jgi:hypothetical protein
MNQQVRGTNSRGRCRPVQRGVVGDEDIQHTYFGPEVLGICANQSERRR